jgi:hypothetical protein
MANKIEILLTGPFPPKITGKLTLIARYIKGAYEANITIIPGDTK